VQWPSFRLKPWQWLLFALGVAVGLVATTVVWRQLGGLEGLRQISLAGIAERIRSFGPGLFFVAMALLPLVGFPVFPFYLAAGAFGRTVALAGGLSAVAATCVLAYLLGRWLLHPVIEKLIARLGRKVPTIPPRHRWLVTILLRVTPGTPFFVQNYLLALGGVPFGVYLLVSIPVAWAYGAGFIIVGESLMSGKTGQLVIGVSLVVVIMIVVSVVRQRLNRRVATLPENEMAREAAAPRE
jgi:uncharacterized membrane protein YdjX (TVP38/TMEM64 family)